MVGLDDLTTLDLLLWLGRGAAVSKRLKVNQSTVSRKAAAVADTFDMLLQRNSDGWELMGDPQLVRMERHVHQISRLRKGCDLRLDADPWLGPALLSAPRCGAWITGCYRFCSHHRPVRLLHERVLDCWLTVLSQEIAPIQRSELTVIELGSMPLQLTVARDHPLAQEHSLDLGDLLRFPRLNLPSGVLPTLESMIRENGLWDSPQMVEHYSPDDWEGKAAHEAGLLYGHALLHAMAPQLRPLAYPINYS